MYVLIGCTGCLGQCILYKLLTETNHSCMILLRAKSFPSIRARITMILQHMGIAPNQIEKWMNEQRIRLMDVAYAYDVFDSPNLTNSTDLMNAIPSMIKISDKDRNYLIQHATVFINALADIRFTRPLRKATLFNTCTALAWLSIYAQCPHVREYVYVSTAFAGFHMGAYHADILEQLHIHSTPEHTIATCETTLSMILQGLKTHIQHTPFENTYTYTKHLTELVLAKQFMEDDPSHVSHVSHSITRVDGFGEVEEFGEVGLGLGLEGNTKHPTFGGSLRIVRPSIIVGASQTPYRGWGKFQTIHVASLGMASGALLWYPYNPPTHHINMVPVDMVADDCLMAMPCPSRQNTQNMEIIHSCLASQPGIAWDNQKETMLHDLVKHQYARFSKDPLHYDGKTYSPSNMLIQPTFDAMKSVNSFNSFSMLIYFILVSFFESVSHSVRFAQSTQSAQSAQSTMSSLGGGCMGMGVTHLLHVIRELPRMYKRIQFTMGFVRLFSPFSSQRYHFVRSRPIQSPYTQCRQIDVLTAFIDHIPTHLRHAQEQQEIRGLQYIFV